MAGTSLRGIVSLIACALVVAVSGITLSFNVYSTTLKQIFSLDQKDVAYLGFATMIGHNILLPAGFFYDKLGPKWSMLPSVGVSCLGWGGLVMLTKNSQHIDFNHETIVSLLAVALLLAGHGRTYQYISGLTTSISNVPESTRPALISTIEIVVGSMPIVLPATFGRQLAPENFKPPEALPSFRNFLYSVLASVVIASGIGVMFMSKNALVGSEDSVCHVLSCFNLKDEDSEELTLIHKLPSAEVQNKNTNNETLAWMNDGPVLRFLISTDYQLVFWTGSLVPAMVMLYDFNLPVLLRAVNYPAEIVSLILIYRSSIIVARVLIALLSPIFTRFPCFPYLFPLISSTLLLVAVILLMVWSDNLHVLRAAFVLLGLVSGTAYIYQPLLICSLFGSAHFGRNVGLVYTAIPFMLLVLSAIFGVTYDGHITNKDSLFCYGKHCFMVALILTLVLAIVCALLSIWIVLRNVSHRKRNENRTSGSEDVDNKFGCISCIARLIAR